MILSDREIEIAINSKQIIFNSNRPLLEILSSSSIDLSLAEQGRIWKSNSAIQIRPGDPNYNYSSLENYQGTVALSNYVMDPGSFLLGWTVESIGLPIQSRLAARVEGKSSLARLGIGIHVTAPIIHAGFSGVIQLEIFNCGPNRIVLDAGMKICQLVFEYTSGTPHKGYAGAFSGQTTH